MLAWPVNAQLEVSDHHAVNNGGSAVLVDFSIAEYPQVVITPPEKRRDWSGDMGLVVPVENREPEAVGLSIHADEDERPGQPRGSLSWWAWLPPNAATTLVLPFVAPDSLSIGMNFGPPIDPQLRGAMMIQKVKGAMNLRRVAAIRLVVPSPSGPRRLAFCDLALLAGPPAGRDAYCRIVDRYGQYSRQTWPNKPTSSGDLRARWARETEELQRRPTPPRVIRSVVFPRRHRFERPASSARSRWNGRRWLVTPEGNRFFSIGVDAIRPGVGATSRRGPGVHVRGAARDGSALVRPLRPE